MKQKRPLNQLTIVLLLTIVVLLAVGQVIETLQAEVENHRNGAEPNDDLTIMCLRC